MKMEAFFFLTKQIFVGFLFLSSWVVEFQIWKLNMREKSGTRLRTWTVEFIHPRNKDLKLRESPPSVEGPWFPPKDSTRTQGVCFYRSAFPQWSKEPVQCVEVLHVVFRLVSHDGDVSILIDTQSVNQSWCQQLEPNSCKPTLNLSRNWLFYPEIVENDPLQVVKFKI